MRKNKVICENNDISILTLDDDEIMTVTLQSYFRSVGFSVDTENDPVKAIERIRDEHFDILLLDFLMRPFNGDEVVRQVREFNKEIFIILLTGHKSMAPPIKTIRELDIQGYYEKSDRFDELELLVESCVKSIKHLKTIHRYEKGLKKILDWVTYLNMFDSVNGLIDTILQQCVELFECNDCCILMDFSYFQDSALLNKRGIVRFKGLGKYLNIKPEDTDIKFLKSWNDDKTVHIYDNKLIASLKLKDGEVFGIIIVDVIEARPDKIQLFEVYTEQVVAILKNLILQELLNTKNADLQHMYSSVHQNYMETINAMRQIVDAKDIYTGGHSDRVSEYAVAIAKAMGKTKEYVERVRIAGLFHDIGKIGIPDQILLKPGPLNDEEYDEVKKHPSTGKRLLSSMSLFGDILDIIESHHERVDGKGYPNGLTGDKIPEESKIISVADTFDAMTSKRTYRDSLTLEQAKDELIRCRGTQFEAEIVDTFIKLINDNDKIKKN